jgi:hypothetical protein
VVKKTNRPVSMCPTRNVEGAVVNLNNQTV